MLLAAFARVERAKRRYALAYVDPASVLDELTRVAESEGVEVRTQALRGYHPSLGGLCRVLGRAFVIVNSNATPVERCGVLASALAELGLAAHPALSEEGRHWVERRGRFDGGDKPAPSGQRARPGLAGLGAGGRRRT